MTQIGHHLGSNTEAFDAYRRVRNFVHVDENRCAFFKRDFLKNRGWHVASVTEGLSRREVTKISSACSEFSYVKAIVLDVDHFGSGAVFNVDLGIGDLNALRELFLAPSYLLVEENENFMLVSDGDYYWSIAGRKDFIEACLESDIDVANQEFAEMVLGYEASGSPAGLWLGRIMRETPTSSVILTSSTQM